MPPHLHSRSVRDRGISLLQGYYAATLLFALGDAFGWSLRVVALDGHPSLKSGYYALCLAAAAVSWGRPALIRPIALVESSINIALLLSGLLLSYLGSIDAVAAGAPPLLTPRQLLNFAISAAALTFAFYSSQMGRERP
jgi:hypothetical protein